MWIVEAEATNKNDWLERYANASHRKYIANSNMDEEQSYSLKVCLFYNTEIFEEFSVDFTNIFCIVCFPYA